MLQFLLKFCQFLFLGSGIMLQAYDIYMGILVSPLYDPTDLCLIHPELVAAGHADQGPDTDAFLAGASFQKFQMTGRLYGIGSLIPIITHSMGNVLLLLIYAGEHDPFHRNLACLAYAKLPRRADFIFVNHVL